MIVRTSLWLILICAMPGLFGQEVLDRLDLGRKEAVPYFLEYSPADDGLVTFGPASRVSSRFLSLAKYDQQFNQQWKKDVYEQNSRKNVDFVSVIGNRILLFASEPLPKDELIRNFYSSYDLEGNIIEDDATLALLPNDKSQKVALQYTLSPNRKRLLCFKSLKKKADSETVLYYMFDETGTLVQNGEIVLDHPDNRFSIQNVVLSNQGNIYLLGRLNQSVSLIANDTYAYLVYRYNTREQVGKELKVDIGNKYISDLAMRVNRDEAIYLSGFYSNKSTDNLAGTLLQVMNTDGQVIKSSTYPFGETFLRNYMTSGQINRGRELTNFNLRDIVMRSDGGVLLVAEWNYTVTRTYRDYLGVFVDRTFWYYRDVVVTSISPAGEIEWTSIIPKEQVYEQPTVAFNTGIGTEQVYVFVQQRPSGMRDNIYYYAIAPNGQQSTPKPLIKDYRAGSTYSPGISIQINNGQMLAVYFQPRNKGLSVARVSLR